MSRTFYDLFQIEAAGIFVFGGDPSREALINILAKESAAEGDYVLIISNAPRKYPIEGKVLVSDETTMLMDLIYSSQPGITYLAANVSNDLLMPFQPAEIEKLTKKFTGPTKLFIDFNDENTGSGFNEQLFRNCVLINCINFASVNEIILDIYKQNSFEGSESIDKTAFDKLLNYFDNNHSLLNRPGTEGILFFNQVKQINEENIIIPVARKLKQKLNWRIFYGCSNKYRIKEC